MVADLLQKDGAAVALHRLRRTMGIVLRMNCDYRRDVLRTSDDPHCSTQHEQILITHCAQIMCRRIYEAFTQVCASCRASREPTRAAMAWVATRLARSRQDAQGRSDERADGARTCHVSPRMGLKGFFQDWNTCCRPAVNQVATQRSLSTGSVAFTALCSSLLGVRTSTLSDTM